MQAYERVGKKGPCLQVIIIEKIRAEEWICFTYQKHNAQFWLRNTAIISGTLFKYF
jgi:hypothetical protein